MLSTRVNVRVWMIGLPSLGTVSAPKKLGSTLVPEQYIMTPVHVRGSERFRRQGARPIYSYFLMSEIIRRAFALARTSVSPRSCPQHKLHNIALRSGGQHVISGRRVPPTHRNQLGTLTSAAPAAAGGILAPAVRATTSNAHKQGT
jgi:hypothetical protein